MIKFLQCFLVAQLAVVAGGNVYGRDPILKLTLKVTDDEGTPVAEANARFGADRRPRRGESEGHGVFAEGMTNREGLFTGELAAWNALQSGYQVKKSGYYGAWGSYRFKPPVRGKWQPWNPTIEVVLKRKKNPVPMYAKRWRSGLGISNLPYAYDLVAGDWVQPHGKGTVSDFIFTQTVVERGRLDFDSRLTVTFSNAGDGIQRFPRDPSLSKDQYQSLVLYEAPADGYANEFSLTRSRRPGQREQTTFDPHSGYFFRVRTVLDAEGKVVKALYGKIYGEFFSIDYYLNPDGTRNIEFDPQRNLLRPAAVTNRDYDLYELGP